MLVSEVMEQMLVSEVMERGLELRPPDRVPGSVYKTVPFHLVLPLDYRACADGSSPGPLKGMCSLHGSHHSFLSFLGQSFVVSPYTQEAHGHIDTLQLLQDLNPVGA